MNGYTFYDSKINTGSQYLTKEIAYFLGGIYAANENVESEGNVYWTAPVRYNSKYSTQSEIAEHFESVSSLSRSVNGITIMVDNIKSTSLDSGKNRLPGFCTFFESNNLNNLIGEIPNLSRALHSSSDDVKKSFILGAIDGRGTPDIKIETGTIRYITIDCPTNEIGNFLNDFFTDCGLVCNYNTSRDRLEGGEPRKPQLRIKNVDYYIRNIGYISSTKFRKLKNAFDNRRGENCGVITDGFLPGLKRLEV